MADVAIIGGGCIGSAAALSLKESQPSLEVVVVDPDFTYEFAATGKGTGGVRQLFTRPENILMSQMTLDIIDDWENWARIDGAPAPDLAWRSNGYLFIVGEAELPTLEANFSTQSAHGVGPVWMDRSDLAERYPEIVTDDMSAGVLSPRDGWLNPKVFFSTLKRKAEAAGVSFIEGRVIDLGQSGRLVSDLLLESGERIPAEAVINAAGVHAPALAARLGIDLPVEPMRRHEHYIETEADVTHLPFFKDVHGLAVHSHRNGVSVGLVDFDHPGGENFTIDPNDYSHRVDPALRHRFDFGELTLRDSWTGLYDQNRFDGNMILGRHPAVAENFYFASGFSGHGFMHAPAVGRALAELILRGSYQTIDLSRMGYERILKGQHYGEEGVR